MPEKDPNLEGNIGDVDLSAVDVSLGQGDQVIDQNEVSVGEPLGETSDVEISQNLDVDLSSEAINENVAGGDTFGGDANIGIGEIDPSKLGLQIEAAEAGGGAIDENLFLDSGDNNQPRRDVLDEGGHFGKYLRLFFFASLLIILGVGAIVVIYFFNKYITEASKPTVPAAQQGFVDGFKDKFKSLKGFVKKDFTSKYKTPEIEDELSAVNTVVDTDDLDYIEKKDILAPYVNKLARNAEANATKIETIKHDIARQGFLPDELDNILSKDQAIDTIQRSLNALEVIKFSTATKVYSYMNSALQTISDMVRVNGASPESIHKLFTQLSSRGENDISSYVYMCYLNPFETKTTCEDIGDLDMYYSELKKEWSKNCKKDANCKSLDMIDIKLFKTAMSAIDQLLETEQTALFSITFNGFNAQDKNITFNIEVYTNQNDEKNLMEQGKKNPNIFILTSIVNLLKQSSFIIGADINTKEVNVETRTLDLGGFSIGVNYSSQEFTVPIQKDTEREIFDYIDLDSILKLLKGEKDEDSEIDNDYEEIEEMNEFEESDEEELNEIEQISDVDSDDVDNVDVVEDKDLENSTQTNGATKREQSSKKVESSAKELENSQQD